MVSIYMTPEARLDRLERVAMLLVRAGFRARSELRDRAREHDLKINHLIDLQIGNEEKFARNEERFARNEERFAKLAESQLNTDQRLSKLIEVINKDRNGNSAQNN